MFGNIQRDYKSYDLKKGETHGVLGIPVFVFSPLMMFSTFGHDEVCKHIEAHMIVNSLSLFSIVHLVTPPQSKHEKYLLIYSRENDKFACTFEEFVKAMLADDMLQCMEV